ncbi:MAG: peptide-methionine (S)-S-oxide reductase MsrA [Alphaproteobacteria bacterium]|nr:peptide-methionine (S)-S-oxide reductase MsrA [Alphaproteobacteria bacterium]MBV9370896.1 peptide-methionine (S)-S-oxide reductase MsrA [Alphaproteobacteria bacterium]MBV9899686.1 peptide-methionine (S)-S-oxide reductase MsrA [Alphaproteobacteria bacterium]
MNGRFTLAAMAGMAALAAGGFLLASGPTASPAEASAAPAPKVDVPATAGNQVAVLAGGCFWGMEGVFEHVKGVRDVVSGYAGGRAADATYEKVGGEGTGHAESVRIVFDPRVVSYGQLLRIYFSSHDPTQLNRQTPDSGPSYRSAIFPQNAAQRRAAAAYIAQLNAAKAFPAPVVTRIESGGFFPAEAYHQDFERLHPDHPYIRRWDAPKLAALKANFPGLYRG